jgi:hypothetical protein
MANSQMERPRARAGLRGASRRGITAVAAIAGLSLVLPWWAAPAGAAGSGTPALKHGGSMTVLEVAASQGADPQGLDPAPTVMAGPMRTT